MRWLLFLLASTICTGCEFPSVGGPEPVPGNAYCNSVSAWPSSAVDVEEDVFALVNQRRSQGANCGGDNFSATAPLEYDGSLICAARKHSQDMVDRGFFDHTNPDGDGPGARAGFADFSNSFIGENIAAGQRSPSEVMSSWMGSAGHCRNIMNSDYNVIGIGFIDNHWTQVFGKR